MMKHYRIVLADPIREFEMQVSALLNEGWECVGGVSRMPQGDQFVYCQALVKETVDPAA